MKDRLTKEISYWDHRAAQLALEEGAGKTGARLNSGEARRRADTLQRRLQKRLEELKRDAQIVVGIHEFGADRSEPILRARRRAAGRSFANLPYGCERAAVGDDPTSR